MKPHAQGLEKSKVQKAKTSHYYILSLWSKKEEKNSEDIVYLLPSNKYVYVEIHCLTNIYFNETFFIEISRNTNIKMQMRKRAPGVILSEAENAREEV